MIVPGPGSLRIVRSAVPDARALAAFVVSPAFLRGADVLKDDRSSTVFAADLPPGLAAATNLSPPGRIVVKVMAHDRPVKRFFQTAFGSTRHLRQWHGAALLMKHGFAAQKPLILFRSRGVMKSPRSPEERTCATETLVLEWLPGKSLLHHMADRDLTPRQEHALADAVGGTIRRLAEAGLGNFDAKPSNWIVMRRADEFALAFIDTVAVREAPGGAAPLDHLSMLVHEPIGVDCFPRRALCWRVVRAAAPSYQTDRTPPSPRPASGRAPRRPAAPRELWRAAAAAVARHGDPTPRVDPLRLAGPATSAPADSPPLTGSGAPIP